MCFCSESSFTHGSLLCLALNLENAENHCHKHADRAERTQEARVRGGRGGRAARDPQRNGHQVRGVAVQAEAVWSSPHSWLAFETMGQTQTV